MIASLDKEPVSGEPPSLFATLATKARKASDATLAGLAAIGGASIVALMAARPRWWMYALSPIAVGAFGLWGILERAICERGANRSAAYDRLFSTLQGLTVAIGAIAAIITAFAVLGIFLGPFIS